MSRNLKRCHIVLSVDERERNKNHVKIKTQLEHEQTIEVLEESLNHLKKQGEFKNGEKIKRNFGTNRGN